MLRNSRRGRRIAIACGIGLFLAPAPPLAEEEEAPQPLREEMQEILAAMTWLLPIALSEVAWEDPPLQDEISRQLAVLARHAGGLESHAEVRDLGFRNLSRSLASSVEEVRDLFESERLAEARFNLVEITGNCVACHSRLPATDRTSTPMARATPDLFESLSAHEKAQILVATRRFGTALETWEEIFADASAPPGQLDMDGHLLDYLTIAIRVQNDPDRVLGTLAEFARRPDMPIYLGRHLTSWQRALGAVGGDLGQSPSLGRARKLVKGEGLALSPALGREQMIYDLVASSLLLRLIDRRDASEAELAEAYYLLGVVEARSVDSYWLPQAEFHLEAAIRLAPRADFAENAYALLEEYILIGYGGLTGADLPLDIWTKLQSLRKLVERAPGPEETD
jgi:hypothetical protein